MMRWRYWDMAVSSGAEGVHSGCGGEELMLKNDGEEEYGVDRDLFCCCRYRCRYSREQYSRGKPTALKGIVVDVGEPVRLLPTSLP